MGRPGSDRGTSPTFDLYQDDAIHGIRGWVTPMLRISRAGQAVGVADLVASIREGRAPVLTPEHARHVLEIMEACPIAASEGRTLQMQTTF